MLFSAGGLMGEKNIPQQARFGYICIFVTLDVQLGNTAN
jgi:hypothetical protein